MIKTMPTCALCKSIFNDEHSCPAVHFDGRHDWIHGDNRQWTLFVHFNDANGHDRFKGSFGFPELVNLGIVKGA